MLNTNIISGPFRVLMQEVDRAVCGVMLVIRNVQQI